MCSWCWGFTPIFERIREHFDKDFRFALVMGGLRPYTQDSVTDQFREEILHHWHDVQKMTGQDFTFDNAMPDGFVYDTEPPARAVLIVGRLSPENTFAFFKAIQHAFYVEQLDVTKADVLAELASTFDVKTDAFSDMFESEEMKAMVQKHYLQTREFGVRGFLTLGTGSSDQHIIFANGFQPYEELEQSISEWLSD
jgi:putative protein-disulfide isomerase